MLGHAQGWSVLVALSSILVLSLALVKERRQLRRAAELDARDGKYTKAQVEIRLLETRAVSLASEIEELERQRTHLLSTIPESARSERLRKALASRVAKRGATSTLVAVQR